MYGRFNSKIGDQSTMNCHQGGAGPNGEVWDIRASPR